MRIRVGVVLASLLLISFAARGHSFENKPHMDSGIVKLYYSPLDKEIAEYSLKTLDESIAEFAPHLPAGDTPIQVVLCRTLPEFREFAGEFGRAQVGGIAREAESIIVVKSPAMLPEGQDYRGTLRHELLHVLLARNCDPAFVPRWFDEGVAMVISKEFRWQSAMSLARMYVSGRLIPYYELDFAFAPLGDEGRFDSAYAEAYSITQFLRARLGDDTFWELVHSLKTMDLEDALRQYAHWTPSELYDAWHRSLWKIALITSLVSGFGVFQIMAFLLILAYWKKRRRNQKTLRQWDDEDRFFAMWGGDRPPRL